MWSISYNKYYELGFLNNIPDFYHILFKQKWNTKGSLKMEIDIRKSINKQNVYYYFISYK